MVSHPRTESWAYLPGAWLLISDPVLPLEPCSLCFWRARKGTISEPLLWGVVVLFINTVPLGG